METTEDTNTDQSGNGVPSDPDLAFISATIATSRMVHPGQQEAQLGTKHFNPGAIVYVIDWDPINEQNVVVIGHHRKSRQFVKAIVGVDLLEGFCMKQVSSPNVITLAKKHATSTGRALTKEHTETMLCDLGARQGART